MKRKLLLVLVLGFLLSFFTNANHLAGGEITYKYIGNSRFEVTFKYYRDCRGDALDAPVFELLCVSSNSKISLSADRVSIRDISNTCKTADKCNPNKPVTSSIPIFEEHTYKDTLDFNGSEAAFKNCCLLKIGMGKCCRTGNISTGGAGQYFWVTSSLDLCNAPTNSSPEFGLVPNLINRCNNPVYLSFNAKDSKDHDSLSYSFTDPLNDWNSKMSWTTGYSSKTPFSDYWPSGFDKSRGAVPYTNPPIGSYLDPQNGLLTFTPTNCSEISKMAVSVKEWRKDSVGKYQQIGEITRDIQMNIITSNNNPPTIIAPSSCVLCEEVQNFISIVSNDKTYNPPPPDKGIYDSTILTWDNGIAGASFKHLDETARLKVGEFSWIPPKDTSNKIYYLTVKVDDNACPYNSTTYKTISITLKPNIIVSHKLTTVNDHIFIGSGGPDTAYKGNYTQMWSVLDSVGNVFKNYTGYRPFMYFNIKSNGKNHSSDTIVFRRNGKYIIMHSIYTPDKCPKVFYDTIIIRNISLSISLHIDSDIYVCEKSVKRYVATVTNGKKPFTYTWKVGSKEKTDTIGYFDYMAERFDTIEVEVTDATGNYNSTAVIIYNLLKLPQFNAGNDKLVCFNSEVQFKATPSTSKENIKKWTWTKDGKIVGNTDLLKTKIPGIYIVKADSAYGCVSYDTVVLENFPGTKPELKDGKFCQNKNELDQSEIILNPPDLKVYTKMEWSVTKSINDKLGVLNTIDNLIKDLDTSLGYNYKLVFGKDIVDLGTSKKDFLILLLTTTDSFKCQLRDTMTLEILKNPEIIPTTNQSYCRNDAIDLSKKIISNLPYKIAAKNHAGYELWPNEGEIINGKIAQKYFKPEGGIYLVKISSENEMCIATDSINLTINPNPVATVSVDFFGDSVKFTDNSKYTTSRNWYVNTGFKTNEKSLVLTRAAAHLKSIKLELKNDNCSFDTTFSVKTLAINNPQNNLIKIYPNPVSETLTLETLNTKPYQIKVFNALGQMVLTKQLNSQTETIELRQLNSGVYTLEILADNQISRVRFLKEKNS